MSENLPQPSWLESLGQLKSIPGAFGAIARLVGGIGNLGAAAIDVPVAQLEGFAQAHRDQKEAGSLLTREAAKAVVASMHADPALGERAVDGLVSELVRKQHNKEAVAARTIENLRRADSTSGSIQEESSDGPSEDWLNVFEAHAERASSDQMREHWGRVLAGEIRKPGSFSLVTLQFMAVLDPKVAAAVELIAPYTNASGFMFATKDINSGPVFKAVVTLEGLGFIKSNLSINELLEEGSKRVYAYGPYRLAIEARSQFRLQEGISYLSQIGREVMTIVRPKWNKEIVRNIGLGFASSYNSAKIHLGEAAPNDDGTFRIISHEEINAAPTSP